MKRQSEELFFKYISKATAQGISGIVFDIPDEYEPIPGDIIEMIISDNGTSGAATYYAKLVVYKDPGDYMYIDALDGKLKGADSGFYPLLWASYNKENGKKTITLFANDNEAVLVETQGNLVNLIVHRSKAEIELYTL